MSGARVSIKWHDATVKEEVRAELARRLPVVGEMLRAAIVNNISEPSRPIRSAPGEFPHADTGKLRQSIFSDLDRERMVVTVGTPLEYGRFLEDGTRNMEARPYLRPTCLDMQETLKDYLLKGLHVKKSGYFEVSE
jgi:HK97 gp10 family phage protein